jgi:hypothetical protein
MCSPEIFWDSKIMVISGRKRKYYHLGLDVNTTSEIRQRFYFPTIGNNRGI